MSVTKPHKKASAPGRGDDSEPPPAAQTCHIRLRLRTADCEPPLTGWLKPQLARIAVLAGVKKGEITLAIVDDKEMAQLHEQYTGVPGTTDVLTFDHRDDSRLPIEADLVICLDTAGREAAARKHDARLEVLLYAVHGLNHLLGGDDHTQAGAQAMHRWEDQMLTAAGFGAVFHRPASGDRPTGAQGLKGRGSQSRRPQGKARPAPTSPSSHHSKGKPARSQT